MPITQDDLAPYNELLGVSDLTPETFHERLTAAVGAALDTADEAKLSLSRAQEELQAVKVERDEAISLSRTANTAPAKPSASEIHWASKAVLAAKRDAIQTGAITPAVADAAEARFLRKPVKLDAISLSREVEADDHKLVSGLAQVLDFYEVVKGNTVSPEKGEQSGLQNAVALARQVPGGEDDPAKGAAEEAEAYQKKQLEARGLK